MNISEIFYSIQGESTFSGKPCVFIRLAGCDLRCTYCDTEYAFADGETMSVPDILQSIEKYPCRLVLITGGEPLLQPDVHDLIRELLDKAYTVLVETGGHKSLESLDPGVHKIMDFKCPSSGMEKYNNYGNIAYLTSGDELKFVVGSRNDFDWACALIRRCGHKLKVENILFSPVQPQVPYEDLAEWILSSGLDVRLQPQLHKIIWPDRKSGV